MTHFTDIELWPDSKLEDIDVGIVESGLEAEQIPAIHRSDSEKTALAVLYEKHAECTTEWNRRIAARKNVEGGRMNG